jgi:hypothetical protein
MSLDHIYLYKSKAQPTMVQIQLHHYGPMGEIEKRHDLKYQNLDIKKIIWYWKISNHFCQTFSIQDEKVQD